MGVPWRKYRLKGKRIGVGIGAGIASYKVAYLVSWLRQLGAEVFVFMTPRATEFVNPRVFEVLSGEKVYVSVFDTPYPGTVGHVEVARELDLLVVAPATADLIARLACGMADDFLTAVVLAAGCPVLVFPSMNANMYTNPATVANLKRLKELGLRVFEPKIGHLACGKAGVGRLPEPGEILEIIEAQFYPKKLEGRQAVVTAGPTREYIDPVRFISNRSSGRMGFALARALAFAGARVHLIAGPTEIEPPPVVETVTRVETSGELREALRGKFKDVDIVAMVAAVCDWRPKERARAKIKRTREDITLTLTPTEDIIAELGAHKGDKILVGFSAETENLLENSMKKLREKNLDMIVANPIAEGVGIASEENEGFIIYGDGTVERVEKMPKEEFAWRIVEAIARVYSEREGG